MAEACMMGFIKQFLSSPETPALAGGLALPRNKPGLPVVGGAIETLAVPETLVIPLTNYKRENLRALVRVGQHVQRGDLLAVGVVAAASGLVISIEDRPIIHPSGLSVNCVIIDAESNSNSNSGKGFGSELGSRSKYESKAGSGWGAKAGSDSDDSIAVHEPQAQLTVDRIEQCGIQGLGGAGFSTAIKLNSTAQANSPIDTLIINAVECEPVISCDEALMMTEADNLVQAIESVVTMSRCKRCIVAIENDKHQAILALQAALDDSSTGAPITIQLLAPVYPSGAERPLIERLTNTRLAPSVHPSDVGIVCINIATAYAAWQAQLGHPLTSRVITVAGEHIQQAVNVRVRFGTSVTEVLRQTGNLPSLTHSRVRAGGPLSGFDLDKLEVPITATTNCITVEPLRNDKPEEPCIRCNACSDVCPVDLLPQQLHWYASADDLVGSARFRLTDCIECGCCDAVCPSNIPLTQTFRYAKGLGFEEQIKQQLAAESATRFSVREEREALRVEVRLEKRKAAQSRLAEHSDPIADALSRVRGRRKPVARPVDTPTTVADGGGPIGVSAGVGDRANEDKATEQERTQQQSNHNDQDPKS